MSMGVLPGLEVPFFRYSHVFRQYREELEAALLGAAGVGAFIMQRELATFEERLAEHCGVDHAIGVGNATDGLEMIVQIAGIGPGDEVVLPAHTFVASASAIVSNGAQPVFAEVGPDHLVDPDDVRRRITSRTKAIMPTQLNGRTADMDALRSLAAEHGLALIEDSAQGLGSRFRGRMAGTFGVAGVYSFYPAKILGGLGDGGAVVTDDAEVAERIRLIRDHGRDPATGEVRCWGRNSRLDNLQAAVLLAKMEHLDAEIARRRQIAARYDAGLHGLSGVVPPPAPIHGEPDHFDTFQNYELEAEDRDALREHLSRAGVGTILQWGGRAVHQHPALGLEASLPRTERMFERALLLPMNSSVTDAEADYVCEQIAVFYGGAR